MFRKVALGIVGLSLIVAIVGIAYAERPLLWEKGKIFDRPAAVSVTPVAAKPAPVAEQAPVVVCPARTWCWWRPWCRCVRTCPVVVAANPVVVEASPAVVQPVTLVKHTTWTRHRWLLGGNVTRDRVVVRPGYAGTAPAVMRPTSVAVPVISVPCID